MNRFLALLLALVLATLTVSSACVAAPSDWIRFTLEPERGGNELRASFRDDQGSWHHNDWSSGFMPSQLVGLDLAGFRASGLRPLHFSVVREPGRLDCSGNGGSNHASGNCSFTPDPAFTQLLVSRGIGRPTPEQALGLMALNVRSETIDAVAKAHYPTPTIDDLVALTAIGVTGNYIGGLAQAGYRPRTIQSLVEFKALDIRPEWISGFVRIGYANLPPEELVQLKALNVTPDFITGFERIGYRNLPVATLVQLKALDVTPEFARSAAAPGKAMPPVNDLVQMKVFGRER
jgi:hypothetical protein